MSFIENMKGMTAKSHLHESPLEALRSHPLRFVCGWRGAVREYFPLHAHRVMELVYHPKGSGITTLGDGRKMGFHSRGIVIYPPLVRHDQRMFAAGEDICIHVGESLAGTLSALFPEPVYIPSSRGGEKHADTFIQTEFANLARLRADAMRRVELDLRVTALVARLFQLNRLEAGELPRTPAELYVDRARQYIAENFSRISNAGEVAKHVGVSEDYLRHLFIEHGGTSINRLLNQTKIERVKELLIHSQMPIKEIAALSGFETERYLSTRFRKLAGISPGAFRRQSVNRIEIENRIK